MHTDRRHPSMPPGARSPRKRFRVILADPPWDAQQTSRHGAAQHYPLMSPQRILGMGPAMQTLAAEQAFCFLWVTTATVPLGIKVLEAWGFAYTSFYFWAKPRLLMGNTFRNAGELLLLGLHGRGTRVSFRAQPNWGLHPLQDHSHKPEEIHNMIERLVGGRGPFLELFARRPTPTATPWDIWGDEVQSTISLAPWGYPVPSDHSPGARP